MTKSINPSTKFTVKANRAYISYIAGKRKMSYSQVKQLITDILADTLTLTLADLEEWIKTYVPKRTGNLQEDLINNLHSSRAMDNIMRLILGSTVRYAEDVNEMSTSQVQHSGEVGYAYYHGYYGKIILNDPEAVGHFWDRMLEFAKRRILINLTKAKYRYLRGNLKVADVNKMVS